MSKKSFSLSEAADLEKPFIGQPKITPQALDEILARYDARMAERVASPSSMASNDNRVVCSYSFFEEVKDKGVYLDRVTRPCTQHSDCTVGFDFFALDFLRDKHGDVECLTAYESEKRIAALPHGSPRDHKGFNDLLIDLGQKEHGYFEITKAPAEILRGDQDSSGQEVFRNNLAAHWGKGALATFYREARPDNRIWTGTCTAPHDSPAVMAVDLPSRHVSWDVRYVNNAVVPVGAVVSHSNIKPLPCIPA